MNLLACRTSYSLCSLLALLLLPFLAALPRGARASHGEEEKGYDFLHTIEVRLGGEGNQMRFFPGDIVLNRGEGYQLVLTNPSPVTHEFASVHLVEHVQTEKVEVFDRDGNSLAYVRGAITEIEVRPGGYVVWAFTPIKDGEVDLFCDIPGHRDAGMVGTIRIQEPQLAGGPSER